MRVRLPVLAVWMSSVLAHGSWAAGDTALNGQFLGVSNVFQTPIGFSQLSLRESTPEWSCDANACSLAAPLKASLVFGSNSGQAQTVQQHQASFFVSTVHKSSILVDPLGHQWAAGTNLSKWSVSVDIASQAVPPGEVQFKSAYGGFGVETPTDLIPLGFSGSHNEVWNEVLGTYTSALYAPIKFPTEGTVTLGSEIDDWPLVPTAGEVVAWDWFFWTSVKGARYALPSSTNPDCSSVNCMEYQTGTLNVSNYALNFDVSVQPLAVPEASTGALMAIGMLGLAAVVARRRQA